ARIERPRASGGVLGLPRRSGAGAVSMGACANAGATPGANISAAARIVKAVRRAGAMFSCCCSGFRPGGLEGYTVGPPISCVGRLERTEVATRSLCFLHRRPPGAYMKDEIVHGAGEQPMVFAHGFCAM